MSATIVRNEEEAPWELLESGSVAWEAFLPHQQEAIVRHYAPRIRFLTMRLKAKLPQSVEVGELMSAGTLGLMEALGKFQPQLGVRFETYAENRIRGAMLDELRRLDWFPRSLRQHVRQLDAAMRRVEHEKGRSATEEELQTLTGLELSQVRQGLEALQSQLCISLETIQDVIIKDGSANMEEEPSKKAAQHEMLERLAPLIERLTSREKLVLSLYYAEELNMRETAEVMGITEGRVSQLHTQALARLRKEFSKQYHEVGTFS